MNDDDQDHQQQQQQHRVEDGEEEQEDEDEGADAAEGAIQQHAAVVAEDLPMEQLDVIDDDDDDDNDDQDQDQDQEEDDDDDEEDEDEEEEALQRPELPGCDITEQEEEWAWEIIGAVEGQQTAVRTCLDFEYVALAIWAQGNVPKALSAAHGLQQFRSYYNVQDSVEECVDILQQFITIQPGVLIHIDTMVEKGEGIAVWNQGACYPARAHTESLFRIHVMAYYYLLTLLQPDFRACREGVFYLIEGRGMVWENFNQEFETRLHDELWMHFPIKVKRLLVYNTNSVVTMAWGLLKRLLPQQQRDVLELGCQIEWDINNPANPKLALSDLYLLPDYNTAMQTCLQRIQNLAIRRFKNQQEFLL